MLRVCCVVTVHTATNHNDQSEQDEAGPNTHLRTGGAHALEREGLSDCFASAAHGPGRVDAQQDGPAVGRRPDLSPLWDDLRVKLAPAVPLVRLQALLRQLWK